MDYRRQGIATVALALQVRTAMKLGIRIITASAAGVPGSTSAGYVVWPRLSFDSPIPKKVLNRLPGEELADLGLDLPARSHLNAPGTGWPGPMAAIRTGPCPGSCAKGGPP